MNTVDDRPQLGKQAVLLLNDLRREFSPLQITMLLAAAQQLHTIDNAQKSAEQLDRVIRGEHIDDSDS